MFVPNTDVYELQSASAVPPEIHPTTTAAVFSASANTSAGATTTPPTTQINPSLHPSNSVDNPSNGTPADQESNSEGKVIHLNVCVVSHVI